MLAAIGKVDRLVACTKYCADVCPEVRDRQITIVRDSWTADTSQIIAAQPDLVVAAVPYQEKAVTEILRTGARFLGLAPKSLADIYTDIAVLSGVLGASTRGEDVIAEMQHEIATMSRQTAATPRRRVFCEEWGKPLIASQMWVAELVYAAGGSFVGTPGAQTSEEDVLREDPDVLIAAWCGTGDRVPLEKILRDRGWTGMKAARQGRVYCIPDEFLNTPAPTLVSGLRALAAAIHPESFPHVAGLKCITDAQVHSASG
jgi:iron complex transport system substrate-binding protein